MDEGSSQKKNKTIDAVIAAVSMAAMGSAVNSSKAAESARVEKKINELGANLERISQQIKALQEPLDEQKLVVASANPAEEDKKPDGVQQGKSQDVIYVRKSTEFSFYS